MSLKHGFTDSIPDDPADALAGKVLPSHWNAEHVVTATLNITSPGTPGDYTLANSAILVKNAGGDEVFRIWGTDPDTNNYNSANLYIGLEAGDEQPTDNTSAGYYNAGIGYQALYHISTGSENLAIGYQAMYNNTTGSNNFGLGGDALYFNIGGSYNAAIGFGALANNTEGSTNTGIGYFAGANFADSQQQSVIDTNMVFIGSFATRGGVANTTPLDNGIAIGAGAVVTGSNKAVIGNASVTDVYFGSDAGLANIHAANIGTGTVTHTGSLTANALVLGNGTADIKVTTTGTGIVTALGVNVGSAGAPVINGGTLGTPSSGTLTSCTGLPVAGITASTSTALGVGSVELGHATDTTLSRASAGVLAVEGVNVETTATLANTKIVGIEFVIDGGGSAITTGIKGDLEIPFACTINRVTLLADQSGSIVVDIWKDTYANYPPTGGDSITASAKPTITTAVKSQDATLTGWTTSITAGDTLRFNVDSITTCQRVTVSLKVTKT